MKRLVNVLIASTLITTSGISSANENIFYGIAHVSLDSISGKGVTKDLTMHSRSSRLGAKGEKTFKGDIHGFYKFEFQINTSDNNDGDELIRPRNMYVGLKDKHLGSILFGRHDTAMKKAIGIKIFTDTVAELTTILGKNVGLYNRPNNSIYYKSPRYASVQLLASVSLLEEDTEDKTFDVKSAALTFKTEHIYASLAHESLDAGQAGSRMTLGYTFSPDNKIGLAYENGHFASGENNEAYVINGMMRLSNLYLLKATYGKRMAEEDETAYGIGFIRDLGDKSDLYIILHHDKDDNTPAEEKTISLGIKYIF